MLFVETPAARQPMTDRDDAALAYWNYGRLARGKTTCEVRIAFVYNVASASVG
jgi:hypothetical protein